jgi:predicted metal-dependent phosphoesterase TrpH
MRIDLHTHTNASDGVLLPDELLHQAQAAGVELLAITDHDSVAGFRQLTEQSTGDFRLISGTEISSDWEKRCVHVLGLNVDINHSALVAGLAQQRQARVRRAEMIAERLARAGFENTLEGAWRIAGDGAIGRLHFAQHLVEIGAAKDYARAFKKYLGNGKPCDVKSEWTTMANAVDWIRQAGGHAVLAHPAKYQLTHRKLEQLVADFTAAGGHALEVVSGAQTTQVTDRLARLAERHGLSASSGSDFHRPGQAWAALGAQPALPKHCRPVWSAWV